MVRGLDHSSITIYHPVILAKTRSQKLINLHILSLEEHSLLDGWSSLVRIPVSHTGGREFKSLLIHRALNTNSKSGKE